MWVMLVQTTKQGEVDVRGLSNLWGNRDFGWDAVSSVGQSGGLLCMWDKGIFEFSSSVKKRNFIIIKGRLKGSNELISVMNVYAPQSIRAKQELWDEISAVMVIEAGLWVVVGDFNAVRFREERRNSDFKPVCARNFNTFIHNLGLLEYNMVGNQFTCVRDSGRKLSKIDRVLVCSNFFNKWPEASLRVLHNLHSDHRPLLLSLSSLNFGHKPFRLFNSWLHKDGFDEVVRSVAASFSFDGEPDLFLTKKLAFIRSKIKTWRDEMIKKGERKKRGSGMNWKSWKKSWNVGVCQ
ncbi:putative Endonuclease/exonuclease/phosphatase superfamily [Helianthus annuus]|nr:putative Endonuclease/exonuclease/phosphatase superfamily [Helianthus annuus]KAJ0504199.1 putative Endonuclease/exonuclease/phosphatase superfamily [Helianthus annuus]KAJ0673904.1 putative Endonuclease/exonuclease/phosphatase superfamily [Helianthus annuus]